MILIVYLNVRLQQYIIYLNLQSSEGFCYYLFVLYLVLFSS